MRPPKGVENVYAPVCVSECVSVCVSVCAFVCVCERECVCD